ncbi:MAG TPA: GGDEF domain-containing protein [Holophagaceae bacterium]|nr:GGDEF domain-containing protein [Holophagaceae bacterium]
MLRQIHWYDEAGAAGPLRDALRDWGYDPVDQPGDGPALVVAPRPDPARIPELAKEIVWWVEAATPEETSAVLALRPGWVLRRSPDLDAVRQALERLRQRDLGEEGWLRRMLQQASLDELLRLLLARCMELAQADGGAIWIRREDTFFQRAGDGTFPEAPLPRREALALADAKEGWLLGAREQMGLLRLRNPRTAPDHFLSWTQTAEPLLLNAWRLEESRLLSFKDDLTVAQNRRCLEVDLPRMVRQTAAAGESLCVIFFDVDNLKALNTVHGHMAGSLVLQTVASGAQRICRAHDRLYRYGGDEFCILMPRTQAGGAMKFGQRLLDMISDAPVLIEGEWVPISLSLGIAAYPAHAEGAEALMKAADQALMRAKAEGKHRVVLAS